MTPIVQKLKLTTNMVRKEGKPFKLNSSNWRTDHTHKMIRTVQENTNDLGLKIIIH